MSGRDLNGHSDSPATAASSTAYWAAVVILACLGVGFVTVRAWVTDDAFITFRHVMNVHAGNGPVFNAGERVQGFTHPLWFLLLLAGSYLLDLYALAVTYGLLLTAATVVMFGWFLREYRSRMLGLGAGFGLLFSSRTFVEYQTSGLESSLTALLVAILFGWLISRELANRELPTVGVFWLLGLLVLNRPDYALFCSPIVVGVIWRWWANRGNNTAGVPRQRLRSVLWLLVICLVVVGWYGFATVYYGTPLPNSAYAKTSVPFTVSLAKGFAYARVYATEEPLHALAAIAFAGLAVGLGVRRIRTARQGLILLCLLVAVVIHVAYVTLVGGDFMRGRVYLPALIGAFVLGVHAVAQLEPKAFPAWRMGLLAVGLMLLTAVRAHFFNGLLAFTQTWIKSDPERLMWFSILLGIVFGAATLVGAFLIWRSKTLTWHSLVLLLLAAAMLTAGLLTNYHRSFSKTLVIVSLVGSAAMLIWAFAYKRFHVAPALTGIILLAAMISLYDHTPRERKSREGIADEWAWWSPMKFQNPFVEPPGQFFVHPGLGDACRKYAEKYGPITVMMRALGIFSYHAGPDVHVLDLHGLNDAFIARCYASPQSRIGHAEFEIPRSYLQAKGTINLQIPWTDRLMRLDESLVQEARRGQTEVVWTDPIARERYERVTEVISGDLFSKMRWSHIGWFMHPDRPPSGRAPTRWRDLK